MVLAWLRLEGICNINFLCLAGAGLSIEFCCAASGYCPQGWVISHHQEVSQDARAYGSTSAALALEMLLWTIQEILARPELASFASSPAKSGWHRPVFRLYCTGKDLSLRSREI